MRIVKYLNLANRVTPTHSFLITTFYNFFSDVNIRGFGTLIPILRILPTSELVHLLFFIDFRLT